MKFPLLWCVCLGLGTVSLPSLASDGHDAPPPAKNFQVPSQTPHEPHFKHKNKTKPPKFSKEAPDSEKVYRSKKLRIHKSEHHNNHKKRPERMD